MNSRERVLEAIAHRVPDRIPIDFWAVPEVYCQLRDFLAFPDDEAVLQRFAVDLRYYNGPAPRSQPEPLLPEGVVQDHWGVLRKKQTVHGRRRDGTDYTWTYSHLLRSPLAAAETVEEIEQHAWPTADMWDFSGARLACQQIRDAGLCVVVGADRLDRTAQLKPAMYLRGAARFMTDLVLNPALAECLLEHISAYYLDYDRRLLDAADGLVDIFFMGDDMGTQASTWVSPELYRRFFHRRLAAYCELAHRYGARVMFHTCGNVTSLVPDFIEAGLDILQSLQPQAMGGQLASIKREYGRELAFQGGIDIQGVLPKGTPEDVVRHVRERARILGIRGGYIFGTAHNILPDTPTENILALVDAYHEYGRDVGG
jgi:uroporphyrinogen decarboxylase